MYDYISPPLAISIGLFLVAIYLYLVYHAALKQILSNHFAMRRHLRRERNRISREQAKMKAYAKRDMAAVRQLYSKPKRRHAALAR